MGNKREIIAPREFAAALVTSTFLMGTGFVAGKILLGSGFSPLLLVGWRFLIAALATLPLVALDHGTFWEALVPRSLTVQSAAAIAVIGLVQTAAVMGLLFVSMRSIPASTAAILLFTSPIWVSGLARLFLKEPLGGLRIAGLVLGVAGVALAIGVQEARPSSEATLLGEATALGAALCFAVATIINKRVRVPVGVWSLSFWQMLIGALALLGIAYSSGEHWPTSVTWHQWAWFFWLSIPASTASFGLWFLALSKGGATASSSFLFLAPLFTVFLSAVFLGTSVSWGQLAGTLCIAIALWMVNR